jgi:electron transport complex protein RnfB
MEGITAIVALGILAAALGLVLGIAARSIRVEGDKVEEEIDALLPQTQCAQCGYPGCRPYAKAIAAGEADINLCAPGGDAAIRALADLLGREVKPLAHDIDPEENTIVAVVDEPRCIGCTLCIQACPVDAIIGAPRQMHTVIATECTGCKLCLPPCPVDCIDLTPVADANSNPAWTRPDVATSTI